MGRSTLLFFVRRGAGLLLAALFASLGACGGTVDDDLTIACDPGPPATPLPAASTAAPGEDGGATVAATPPTVLLADSVAEFSGTQGAAGWQYGSETAPDFTFVAMPQFDGTTFWVDEGVVWTRLWSNGGHPNGRVTSGGRDPILQYAVRRWVSNVDATVEIKGHVAKADADPASHGIVVEIDVDGARQWGQAIDGQDGVGVDYAFTSKVAVGSNVDFILMPAVDGVDWSDRSTFTAQIYG